MTGNAALRRFFERDAATHVAPSGRSLVLRHDAPAQRVALLLHGLSAAPAQFAAVASALHDRGYNVFVPRLPAHGHVERSGAALRALRDAHLARASDDMLAAARELGSTVVVAGFSLGGLLAARLAQSHDVERVVAIAPFLGVAWLPERLRAPLARFTLRIPNYSMWWDPIRRGRGTPDHGYPRWGSHAIAHGLTLSEELLRAAARHAPRAREIILVKNARETGVSNRAIDELARRWMQSGHDGVSVRSIEGLPFSHDIVEPLREGRAAELALPHLLEAIDPGGTW